MLDVKAPAELKEYKYHLSISGMDCTGCGVCVKTCPTKALTLKAFAPMKEKMTLNGITQSTTLKIKKLMTNRKQQLRAASSLNHTLSSQVLVLVVVKHHTLNLLHSFTAAE